MRTKNEKLICPIAEDLIDIVSLSRMCAARDGMQLDEACHFVTMALVNDDEVTEVYRTDKPGLPECIGEINGKYDFTNVLDALWMPFQSKWWEDQASLTVIHAKRVDAPDSVAIRWTDAERAFHLSPKGQHSDLTNMHEGLSECLELGSSGDERSRLATKAAQARHAKTNEAKTFVRQEWEQHRDAYKGNKTAFSRDYVRRVKHELDVTITEKQLREVWLSDP